MKRPTTIPARPTTIARPTTMARPTTITKYQADLDDATYSAAVQAAYRMIKEGTACVFRLESGEYKPLMFEAWKKKPLGRCVLCVRRTHKGMEVGGYPPKFSDED